MKAFACLGTALVVIGMVNTAQANSDHWDQFSCYAYVHDQCYANGEENCSSDDYEWGLNECDGYYPSSAIVRPTKPMGLVSAKPSRTFRMTIRQSMRSKF